MEVCHTVFDAREGVLFRGLFRGFADITPLLDRFRTCLAGDVFGVEGVVGLSTVESSIRREKLLCHVGDMVVGDVVTSGPHIAEVRPEVRPEVSFFWLGRQLPYVFLTINTRQSLFNLLV